MALQFVLGPSGCGKSYYMCKEMVEKSVEDMNNNIFAIVPEQFTMQTQKDVVLMHPNRGTMNIDIVSFGRLAYRIFEELGYENPEILDDTGKNLILRRVIEKEENNLTIYKNKANNPGFTSEMKSVISEFCQYDVSLEMIEEMIKAADKKPVLRSKLSDIRLIYSSFKETIAKKYTTKEELLGILCSLVSKSKLLAKSEIYLDGFTGFTPIQYRLLQELLKVSKNVKISLTINPEGWDYETKPKEYELFALSKKTILKLKEIAKNVGCRVEAPICSWESEVPIRFSNSMPIAGLEKNIFRYNNVKSESKDDIKLTACGTKELEVQKVCIEIQKLIREKGYRYKDIAVVTGDMDGYRDIVSYVFDMNKVPCFIDYKRKIKGNPMINAILCALNILEENYSYDSVMSLLKTGMTGIDYEKLCKLENYVRKYGIKGKKWGEAFDDEAMEALRKEVIAPIIKFKSDMAGKTVREKTKAVYAMIEGYSMNEKINKLIDEFEEENKAEYVKEYSQVYKLVMELLEKMEKLLGDEKISRADFVKVIQSGFEELKCGIIPPCVDQVTIGDIERTRLKDVKALFFIGVNEGIVPKTGGKSGLLTQKDKNFLESEAFVLSPTALESSYIQRFYLYLNLTKPTEKLYISYSLTDVKGEAMEPSYLIKTIEGMYSDISIDTYTELSFDDVYSERMLTRVISENIADYVLNNENKELITALQYKKPENILNAAFLRAPKDSLTGEVAKLIYDKKVVGGISRFEKFASCSFNHFLKYGLGLKIREEFEINLADVGTVIHNSLDRFSKTLKEQKLTWAKLDDNAIDELVENTVDLVAEDEFSLKHSNSDREKYLVSRAKRIVKRTAKVLRTHLDKGKFLPEEFEFEFTKELENVRLIGRIDRMDCFEDEKNIFVKVIDYKTGTKEFKIEDVELGLELQLVTYMGEAMDYAKQNSDKNVIPAGLFYYLVKDPYFAVGDAKDPLKNFKMNGLVNTDREAINALEVGIEGNSVIVPVGFKKDGDFSSSSSVIDNAGFEELIKNTREKIDGYGKEMLEGNIDINPYSRDKRNEATSCKYCEFSSICNFNEELPGFEYRKLYKEEGNE